MLKANRRQQNMTIGDIIKNRRKEMNMRQEDLAELVGTTKATVSRWESGDIHKMKRPMIVKLAKVLQLDPLIFLQREEVLMPDEERLITAYRQASDEIKGAALAMLEDSAAKSRKNPVQESSAG
jgi:transcriptional regulator with XRE-family HTH domain